MTRFFYSPLRIFLLRAGLLLVGWVGLYICWLAPQQTLDHVLSKNLAQTTAGLLRLLGIAGHVEHETLVSISNQPAVWVGNPCNGLVLYALFAGFVLAFPGDGKRKGWFIPVGCSAIYGLNVVRVAALAILQHWGPAGSVDFNHHYTFNLIVYGAIGALWMSWVRQEQTAAYASV